ncbi:hypothetical protein KR51_00033660 [Rubidibacter lacunae KORDI 51-2]|uniref:Uncharacterized protein n=1 Tax=Rubidibacter lacunae KORDI 51-2 TaxID=582515 RepID=U5DEQ6_9CHRO|nr:hypothetical protein KR51_00033660 [Rubidibacter lacunae KORDI 51-2]
MPAKDQQTVLPQLRFFLAATPQATAGYPGQVIGIFRSLTLTIEPAQGLQLKPRSQLSPLLGRCCLGVSALFPSRRWRRTSNYSLVARSAPILNTAWSITSRFQHPSLKILVVSGARR